MDDAVIEKYEEAGAIAKDARQYGVKLAEPGTKLATIAEEVESFIRDRGAQPAFPVNVSIDDVAAHYTPGIGDDAVLEEDHLVNIDVGVHVDGYIGDTAVTVDPSGKHTALKEASEDALSAALDLAEAGVTLGAIGAAIEETIEGAGFKPIRNLSGHGLDQYVQHSGMNIPNVATGAEQELDAGQAVAIEPFATDGAGKVKDGSTGNIYKLEDGRARGRTERKVLGEVKDRFQTLPFTARWIDSIPQARVDMTLSKLVRSNCVHAYDVLKEADGGQVSQTEHTVLILEDDTIVTTR